MIAVIIRFCNTGSYSNLIFCLSAFTNDHKPYKYFKNAYLFVFPLFFHVHEQPLNTKHNMHNTFILKITFSISLQQKSNGSH